jgi:hypothetical protein
MERLLFLWDECDDIVRILRRYVQTAGAEFLAALRGT